jgi:uncharacterized membrane protein YfcA
MAVAMGLTQGLLGAGGAILAVPILRYVMGFEPKQAIALSLAVVAITSLIGAWRYWRAGHVHPAAALPFAAVSMIGSFEGARAARHLDGRLQLLLFSALMLAASITMLMSRPVPAAASQPVAPLAGWRATLVLGPLALGIGVLTGVAGIGGGFIIVPALMALAHFPIRSAAGISLVATGFNAAAGLLGYAGHVTIPYGFLSIFATAAVAGILAGTSLVRFVPPVHLRRAFALALLALGIAILIEHRDLWLAASAIGRAIPVT